MALTLAANFFGHFTSSSSSRDVPPSYTSNNKNDTNNNNNNNDTSSSSAPTRQLTRSLSSQQIRTLYESKNQKRAFVSACKRNRKLITSSKVFDGHALATAFLLLQRLNLKPYDYTDDNLYCALYMAVAMDEDSEEGVHELLVHRVGVSVDFPELDYTNVKHRCVYEKHEEWRKELHRFHAKVNAFWKALDFRTFVDIELVMQTQAQLAGESSLFRPRKQETLESLAPFW